MRRRSLDIFIATILLISPIAYSRAQPATPDAAPDEQVQTVAVSGTRDPDWKPYRKMLDGLDAYDKYHALAPDAPLKFILRPQTAMRSSAGLTLRIVGDQSNINVPIADDDTFSIPRDAAAAKEDADVRLNSKKGLYRWRPDIHTPGIAVDARRLGDLRLECEVRWAVDKFDLSFIPAAYLTTLGGACHSSRGRVYYSAPKTLAAVTLHYGERHETLKDDRINPNDRTRYAPPIHDESWPDNTIVTFEY